MRRIMLGTASRWAVIPAVGVSVRSAVGTSGSQNSSVPSMDRRKPVEQDALNIVLEQHHEKEDPLDHDDAFDEVEASAQEIHDITYAMIWYLRHADPDDTKGIMSPRMAKHIVGPIPEVFRLSITSIKVHGGKHFDFRNKAELDQSTKLFLDIGAKLLPLLNQDVMDRMLENSKRLSDATRKGHVAGRGNTVAAVKANRFRFAKHYRHAPFEIQHLRADIPESYVQHGRALRDRSTLAALQALLEPNHAFRERLESAMWSITRKYDSLDRERE